MKLATPVDRFLERARNHPTDEAYFVRKRGSWEMTTWGQFGSKVQDFAKGLMALQLAEGQSVAILGHNRPEWVIACLGTQMANAISAGIYTSCSSEEVAHVVEHSGAQILVIENAERFRKQLLTKLHELPNLRKVIVMDPSKDFEHELMINFSEVMKLGREVDGSLLEERIHRIHPEKTATLIYTSGTTGPAKGVMLSHKAIDWTVNSVLKLMHVGKGDSFISYLPLAHIAEQMFSVYAPSATGLSLYFAESMEKLPEHLKEIQPTLFFGVPRIYEKFHDRVKEKLETITGPKAWLFRWAQSVAIRVWTIRHRSGTVGTFLNMQYGLARRLIFNRIKPVLGLGRARVCVTAAAPISPEILSFFLGLDIPIYEVYGQSEDCGPTTINLPGATRIGAAGRPLPGVEIRLADDGEILVKGPNLFSGYFKDEEATKAALSKGWLQSGDVGTLDQEGFLRITDRKKDLLITAGGKNIAPQNLERMLKQIPLVSSAVVIGDRRKYLAALLTPNSEGIHEFAKKRGLSPKKMEEFVQDSAVRQAIDEEIRKINSSLAPVEQIRRFTLLPKDFTVEEGELTPTLKIKRKVINARYVNEINELYS